VGSLEEGVVEEEKLQSLQEPTSQWPRIRRALDANRCEDIAKKYRVYSKRFRWIVEDGDI
jgi:hypothetical protein